MTTFENRLFFVGSIGVMSCMLTILSVMIGIVNPGTAIELITIVGPASFGIIIAVHIKQWLRLR